MISPRRLAISAILAGALALMVWGFTLVRPTDPPITFNNPAIHQVTPRPGDQVLRQTRISVILNQAYTLSYENAEGFAINNIGIPQDELEIIPGLNQYVFTASPNKLLAELPPNRVCVSLLIKRMDNAPDPNERFSWCFATH